MFKANYDIKSNGKLIIKKGEECKVKFYDEKDSLLRVVYKKNSCFQFDIFEFNFLFEESKS